jgi:hypothetical protein
VTVENEFETEIVPVQVGGCVVVVVAKQLHAPEEQLPV